MSIRACITALGGLLVAAHPLCAQPADEPFFTGIGDLPGGLFGSFAKAVSGNGRVVVGESTAGGFGSYEMIRWTLESGMEPLDSDWRGDVWSTDGRGAVIGGAVIRPIYQTTEAYRWTESERIVRIGDLPGGEFRSSVQGVSTRGDILVGSSSSEWSGENYAEGFFWTEKTGMVVMEKDLPDSTVSYGGKAFSADGRVVIGAGRFDQGLEAIRWTAETGIVRLGHLPGGNTSSAAYAVSADGAIVVGNGFNHEGQRAFRWTEETGMVEIDKDLQGIVYQRAYSMSWDGDVIVGEMDVYPGPFGAFYWTPETGSRFLTDVLDEHGITDHHGWHFQVAYGVSADGRTIVGGGINPDGDGEGWVAYLGPACRADFNDDGEVDASDVIAYIAAWQDHNIFADWNYDGSINTRDLLGFLNEWVAKPGCE